MKIVVVGCGYVGVAMSVLLAQRNEVVALDLDPLRVDLINRRISPIRDEMVQQYLDAHPLNLRATLDKVGAYAGADYVVVATPTNYDVEHDWFDTQSVDAVIRDVRLYNPRAVVVIKSTVPIGYTEEARGRLGLDALIFSPEFLREGRSLEDNLHPSRIVVGERSERAKVFANLLVQGSLTPDCPVLLTGSSEAESIKLFANTYLAMRVAYFNELDSFAAIRDLNSKEIIEGIGLDPRIGCHYNNPSFGYGGYCLPKDTKQLLSSFQQVPQTLMHAIVEANRVRKQHIADSILLRAPGAIGVYRLNMKTDSDNHRESSVIAVLQALVESGREVMVYEPMLESEDYLGARVVTDLQAFKQKAQVIVANRVTDDICDVVDKIFTRDLFGRD